MSLKEGRLARDEGMDAVAEHAENLWRASALLAVQKAASKLEFITIDDVSPEIPESLSTHDLRALGPIMVKGKKEGWITPTDRFTSSRRSSCHATPRRVWKSLIYGSWEGQGSLFGA